MVLIFFFFKLTIKVSFLTFKCQILFCNQFIANIYSNIVQAHQ